MAVKCSGGITCQCCCYSLFSSVRLSLLLLMWLTKPREAGLCLFRLFSVHIRGLAYVSCDFSAAFCMYMCVSQSSLLRGKLVNTWFQIKKKVSRTITLRAWWISLAWSPAAMINRHLFQSDSDIFSFGSLFHFTIWKLLNQYLTKPLAISSIVWTYVILLFTL